MFTCKNFLPEFGKDVEINYALDNALKGAKLGVQPQSQEHQEKQDRPQVGQGELVDSLGEENECQARTGGGLKRMLHNQFAIF